MTDSMPTTSSSPFDPDPAPDLVTLDPARTESRALIGGKAANLVRLLQIDGLRVPQAVCVTTHAFGRIVERDAAVRAAIARLERVAHDDRTGIRAGARDVRDAIERVALPVDFGRRVRDALAPFGAHAAFAVRSSATSEDAATHSFAGQHDSYLDVMGIDEVLPCIRRCWASLYTERAVRYRQAHAVAHRDARMAVVIQRMVAARASGVMFTADPVNGHRRVVAIEAVHGLGDALVSGRADADAYRVRDDALIASVSDGALTDAEALALARLGRRIEAHFGAPQDVEWCLDAAGFHVVQSRAITTLFPVPDPIDEAPRVFLSVGHQQMMTDAMTPLGISIRQHTSAPGMRHAGGRLFVDVTRALSTRAGRASILASAAKYDPLTHDAIATIIERGFVPLVPDDGADAPRAPVAPNDIEVDANLDRTVVDALIAENEASLSTLADTLDGRHGAALLDAVAADFDEMKRPLFDPRNLQAIMAGMNAAWWLNEHLREWLGDRHAADTLSLSVADNVTSEMGLALLDIADRIRPYPAIVGVLADARDASFLARLDACEGGADVRVAIEGWLRRYGSRGPREIDVAAPRWHERPDRLVPTLLAHVRDSAPGEAAKRFDEGREKAHAYARDVLDRLRALPGDPATSADDRQRERERRITETRTMIGRVRDFAGYREYPKFGIVRRYAHYRRAVLDIAAALVAAGAIESIDDVFFLTFDELRDAARTGAVDRACIVERRAAFARHRSLTPPRVLTSDGECLDGAYRRADVPAGALVGLAVSSGLVEGRARVVLDPAEASLETGDILVTRHTDPGWTPLFTTIAGVVTEVGGFMTHGAVIAREYGLPAVVGVRDATTRLRDGQRIRLDAIDGCITVLD